MKVEIYSDVVCPWCYIGERRFERALAAFPGADGVDVVYRPYQLDPSTPTTARPLMERLAKKFGARAPSIMTHVTEAATGEGLDFSWGRALAVNTLTAHRLLHLAEREYGPAVQRALMEQLFSAYFVRGGDVGDRDQLAGLAQAAGMDGGRVAAYLASDEGLADVVSQIAAARALGITAVPTFIFDSKYAVEGAQPTSTFRRVLEEVARESMAAAGDTDGQDACGDGACVV